MKILFVSASNSDEPLGIMLLSSYLKKHSYEVKGAMSKKENVIEIAEKFMPDIIAFSVITGEEKDLLDLNRKLKEKLEFLSLWGGPHPTFSPEMIEIQGVDAICIGEGEDTMLEIADAMKEGKSIEGIRNLWVKKGDKIIKNELRLLEENLDKYPFADREIFARHKEDDGYNMLAIRGCPFNCTYCFNHIFNKMYSGKGKIIRHRSVKNVMREIKEIESKHKVGTFKFHDDTFIINKEWFGEFCKKYPRTTRKQFICNIRTNLVDEKVVDLLKNGNCKMVYMGVEAGNDRIRNEVMRRGISKQQITECAKLVNQRGIKIFTQNMLGLPTSTIEDDYETLELNVECKPFFAWVSIFTPYPKTELAELAKKTGFKELPETYHYKTVLNIPHAAQVNMLHKLFSMCVEYPKIIPKVKEIVANCTEKNESEFKRIREIQTVFKEFKHQALNEPSTKLPDSVKVFLKECGVDV